MCLQIDQEIGGCRLWASEANDRWEMKIVGPNAFERSYTLEGSADEHQPETFRVILGRMLPGKKA